MENKESTKEGKVITISTSSANVVMTSIRSINMIFERSLELRERMRYRNRFLFSEWQTTGPDSGRNLQFLEKFRVEQAMAYLGEDVTALQKQFKNIDRRSPMSKDPVATRPTPSTSKTSSSSLQTGATINWAMRHIRAKMDPTMRHARIWAIFILTCFNYNRNLQIIYPHPTEKFHFRIYTHYTLLQVLFSTILKIPGHSLAKVWLKDIGIDIGTNGRHLKSIFTKYGILGFSNEKKTLKKGRKGRISSDDFFEMMPVTNSNLRDSESAATGIRDDDGSDVFSFYTRKSFIMSGQTVHFFDLVYPAMVILFDFETGDIDHLFETVLGLRQRDFWSALDNHHHVHLSPNRWGRSAWQILPGQRPNRWFKLIAALALEFEQHKIMDRRISPMSMHQHTISDFLQSISVSENHGKSTITPKNIEINKKK